MAPTIAAMPITMQNASYSVIGLEGKMKRRARRPQASGINRHGRRSEGSSAAIFVG